MDSMIVVAVMAFFVGLMFRSGPSEHEPIVQYVPVRVRTRGAGVGTLLILGLMGWLMYRLWELVMYV